MQVRAAHLYCTFLFWGGFEGWLCMHVRTPLHGSLGSCRLLSYGRAQQPSEWVASRCTTQHSVLQRRMYLHGIGRPSGRTPPPPFLLHLLSSAEVGKWVSLVSLVHCGFFWEWEWECPLVATITRSC